MPLSGESFVAPFNVTGGPALSVPCGFDPQGLPIGLQFAVRPRGDAAVLVAAHQHQQASDWQGRRPTSRP